MTLFSVYNLLEIVNMLVLVVLVFVVGCALCIFMGLQGKYKIFNTLCKAIFIF